MRKPIIGITSNFENIKAVSNHSDEFVFVRYNYISAILENGGIPLIINSKIDHEDAEHIVARLDGVLFIGGQDVDPQFYGEECAIDYVIFMVQGLLIAARYVISLTLNVINLR